jgi:DNA topoisomerase-1
MRLLIVESPTKAEALASMLGPEYRVRATKGHVMDLPDDDLGVDTTDTFEGEWQTAKGQRNVLAGLRKDAAGCDKILLATDPDREGEAIAHHLTDALARTGVPTARVSFNEVTPETVRRAVARPRRIDGHLVAAQHARRVVDRLVGYTISPVLQRSVSSPRALSAGRVQTAALRLLCEREEALADFTPVERWHIQASFVTESGDAVEARLHRAYRQTLEDDTLDEGAAWHLVETMRPLQFRVRSVRTSTEALKPPPPFTTATLIEAASRHLGLDPAQTMRTAQQLYEGVELEDDVRVGLLTYPRTDGVRMAKSAIAAARNIIARDFGTGYLPPQPLRHTRPGAGEPEAHEALRPTDFDRAPKAVRKYLTPVQYRLYRLIWDRAVASQVTPATLERTTATIADAEGQFEFRAEGVRVRARGFLQFEAGGPEEASLAPSVTKGATVATRSLTHVRRLTTPPERYTEAGLVAAMEAHGIGRPSTFASTLATLRERGYAALDDGRLRPTDIGHRACTFLVRRFPSLFDLDFTAQLESTLDAIAAGKAAYRPALHHFYHSGLLPALNARPTAASLPGTRSGTTSSLHEPPACPRCNRQMTRRSGPHGAFYGCSGYPDCRETRPYVDPAQTRRCPRCEQGWIVQRTTKTGRSFEGCSAYPACDFARWTSPAAQSSGS